MKESTATQIGRDDYKACEKVAAILGLEDGFKTSATCPFPKGSADAAEWLEGWNREEMLRRNPNSKAFQRQLSSFQKVRKIMEGEA